MSTQVISEVTVRAREVRGRWPLIYILAIKAVFQRASLASLCIVWGNPQSRYKFRNRVTFPLSVLETQLTAFPVSGWSSSVQQRLFFSALGPDPYLQLHNGTERGLFLYSAINLIRVNNSVLWNWAAAVVQRAENLKPLQRATGGLAERCGGSRFSQGIWAGCRLSLYSTGECSHGDMADTVSWSTYLPET